MNKKVISKLALFTAIFFAISLIIAKLIDIGLHRPSMVYEVLNQQAMQYVDLLSKNNPDMNFQVNPYGPLDWDNTEDLGQKKTCGKWDKEEDASAVAYYRKDKEAEGQMRARKVMQLTETVLSEVADLIDTVVSPDSLNGKRKLPIYLPETEEEYHTIVSKLSDGEVNAGDNQRLGLSIREVGPMGCKTKGIVINPVAFKERSSNGDLKYVKVVRREIFYYAYFTSVDYSQNVSQPLWLVDGMAEYFAQNSEVMMDLPADRCEFIIKSCSLTGEFPKKERASSWAGCSFFQFYAEMYGEEQLTQIAYCSMQMPFDSLCTTLNLDLEMLQQQWYQALVPTVQDSIVVEAIAEDNTTKI